MSPSSDIETLFGHFGGDAGGYQEIGRENEASTARTRWPLLVTLDLKQTTIPAIATHHERVAASPSGEVTGGAAQHGEQSPAAHATNPGEATATSTLRSKAPLFTRPHRRNVPPVANVVKSDAPRGGERFGAIPEVLPAGAAARAGEAAVLPPVVPAIAKAAVEARAQSAAESAAQLPSQLPAELSAGSSAQPVAAPTPGSGLPVASAATVPPVFSRPAAIAPALAPTFAQRAIPPVMPSAPVTPVTPSTSNLSNPPVTPARSPLFNSPARQSAAPSIPPAPSASLFARAPAATQPPPILGRLFASAAPQSAPAAQPLAGAARPTDLRSVFDRLRGASNNAPAPSPAPHSWLNNGPRRS